MMRRYSISKTGRETKHVVCAVRVQKLMWLVSVGHLTCVCVAKHVACA